MLPIAYKRRTRKNHLSYWNKSKLDCRYWHLIEGDKTQEQFNEINENLHKIFITALMQQGIIRQIIQSILHYKYKTLFLKQSFDIFTGIEIDFRCYFNVMVELKIKQLQQFEYVQGKHGII